MDSRTRNTLSGWFAEAGFLYVVVVIFVSLVFLIREGWDHFSSSPTISRRTTIEGGPGYYGRNP
ncbi:MAG: hypothetical protein HYW07_01600 [Candidatus Latescibacteria bacterium]|nr:hypothetical protein [Candidatus Latescibacterota bacterium]